MKIVTDQEMAAAWRSEQNYAALGRKFDISRQSAKIRILRLRASGWDLPPARPAGYALTSDQARKISLLRRSLDDTTK